MECKDPCEKQEIPGECKVCRQTTELNFRRLVSIANEKHEISLVDPDTHDKLREVVREMDKVGYDLRSRSIIIREVLNAGSYC